MSGKQKKRATKANGKAGGSKGLLSFGACFTTEGLDPSLVFDGLSLPGAPPQLSELISFGCDGPPPPEPGKTLENDGGYTDEDRSSSRLVGDYRVGSILGGLPEPEIDVAPVAVNVDAESFVRLLRNSLVLRIGEKYHILASMPQFSQFQMDETVRLLQGEQRAFKLLPPRGLIILRPLEWEAAEAWCELEIAVLRAHRSFDRIGVWQKALRDLRLGRLEALRAGIESAKCDGTLCVEHRCEIFKQLGSMCCRQGHLAEAEEVLVRAVQMAAQNEGIEIITDNSDVLCMLGTICREQDRLAEAEDYLLQSLRLVNEHGLSVLTRRIVQRTCEIRGRGAEPGEGVIQGMEMFLKEILVQRRLEVLCALGTLLCQQGRLPEAEAHLTECVRLVEDHGFSSSTRCNVLIALGTLRRLQRRFKEAEESLMQAIRVAEDRGLHPLICCSAFAELAAAEATNDKGVKAVQYLRKSRRYLLETIPGLLSSAGIFAYLRLYSGVFELSYHAADRAIALSPSVSRRERCLWELLRAVDEGKCVLLREGLQRHRSAGRGGLGMVLENDWSWGPAFHRDVFHTYAPGDPRLNRVLLRRAAKPEGVEPEKFVLEFPEAGNAARAKMCRSIRGRELLRLIPTDETVLIQFSFVGDDLIVMPIRREPGTYRSVIRHVDGRPFRVAGVRGELWKLLEMQSELPGMLDAYELVGSTSNKLNDEHNQRRSVYGPLNEILQWDRLLECIRWSGEPMERLHLVLIPDDVLYGFPLHAAWSSQCRRYLYERVSSAAYAISLGAIHGQQQIERRDRHANDEIHATLFTNPDQEGDFLSHAAVEVDNLVEAWGKKSVRVFGDVAPEWSTREQVRHWHMRSNVVWFIGHGGLQDDSVSFRHGRKVDVRAAAFKACDGAITDVRMVEERYDYRRVRFLHTSCCTLGRMQQIEYNTLRQDGLPERRVKATRELEGFVASLTLLGCRRVSSALWELCDAAAAVFGRCLASALKNGPLLRHPKPHAFAVAYKQALTQFRQFDGGRYDHEFYWAPYVLYGADLGGRD